MRLLPPVLVVAVALLLAACGGGGGGGNGDGPSAFKLRVVVINETEEDATIQLNGLEPGEPNTLASCTAQVFTFDLPEGEDWTLVVNEQTAIDSLELTEVQIDRNLIAEVIANEDGTVEQLSLTAGGLIGAPAQAGICT
jgi:hypothetical protein